MFCLAFCLQPCSICVFGFMESTRLRLDPTGKVRVFLYAVPTLPQSLVSGPNDQDPHCLHEPVRGGEETPENRDVPSASMSSGSRALAGWG